jgi:hypothetical protein
MSNECPHCLRGTVPRGPDDRDWCKGAASTMCIIKTRDRAERAERIAREALDLASGHRAHIDYTVARLREELDGGKP